MKTKIWQIASRFNYFAHKRHLERVGVFYRIQQLANRFLLHWVSSQGELVLISVMGKAMYVSPAYIGSYGLVPFEPFSIKLFKQALKPGMTVLDIGAHFGLYSLIAANAPRSSP